MKRTQVGLKNRLVGCHLDLLGLAQRIGVGALALILGAATVGTPSHAIAAPVSASSILQETSATVYLFDSDNHPVLAPNALINEGGVYTDAGFIGTLDANSWIVDIHGAVVGYVTYSSPG